MPPLKMDAHAIAALQDTVTGLKHSVADDKARKHNLEAQLAGINESIEKNENKIASITLTIRELSR